MRVVVAARFEDRGHAHFRHAHERVARARRDDRVRGDLHAAVGAVLETDRAAQPRSQLPMTLALGRARADGAPRDQIGDVLRAEQVEKFGGRGQPETVDVEQQLPRETQAFVDAEAAVQTRVVDIAFPADRGARLLEVDAHHDQQIVLVALGRGLQLARVFDRLIVIVNRTRADDQHETVVAAMQNVGDFRARFLDERLHRRRHRQFVLQQRGGNQRTYRADPNVVDARGVLGGVGRADFLIVQRIVDGAQNVLPDLDDEAAWPPECASVAALISRGLCNGFALRLC